MFYLPVSQCTDGITLIVFVISHARKRFYVGSIPSFCAKPLPGHYYPLQLIVENATLDGTRQLLRRVGSRVYRSVQFPFCHKIYKLLEYMQHLIGREPVPSSNITCPTIKTCSDRIGSPAVLCAPRTHV